MSTNLRTQCLTDQWGTPDYILEGIRGALGGVIHLDVCSSWEVNKTVRAERVITADSLDKYWGSHTVYCNPPSGKVRHPNYPNSKTNPQAFWEKINQKYDEIDIDKYCYLCYNLDQLVTNLRIHNPNDLIIVLPHRRIRFIPLSGQKAGSPAHSNALIFRGVSKDDVAYHFPKEQYSILNN